MSGSVFLVQRRPAYRQELRLYADQPSGFAPFVAQRLFSDRAAAEAYRDEILHRLRRTVNPFALRSSLRELTSMRQGDLINRLWGLEVFPPEVPKVGEADWRGWWDETAPGLTREKIDAVWALFDLLRLVEVVELPLDRQTSSGVTPAPEARP